METDRSRSRFFYSISLLTLSFMMLVACRLEPASNVSVTVTQEFPVMPVEINLPVSTTESIPATTTRQPPATNIPSTSTLDPSPIPTLSLAEKEAMAAELYDTNANCNLPCWWGIVPGETEWQIAKYFLSTIATRIIVEPQSESDPVFVAEVDIPVPENLSEIGFLRHNFVVEDGIIVKIRLETPWGTRKIDTVSEILNNYGTPAEVWLDTWGYTFGEYYPFSIALFYPNQGILVRYSDEAELTDGYVTGCPQNHSGKLSLWSPKRELTFIESLGKQQGQYHKPLEETTEMSVEMFYQTYLDPGTEFCIETPAELWLDR